MSTPSSTQRPGLRRGDARRRSLDQLREVTHHDVGAVVEQRLGSPLPVHPHHQAEASGAARRHARQSVLEDRRVACGRAPSSSAARRNESGAGLPFRCSRAITTPSTRASKRSAMPAALQYLLGVGARGDHRGLQARSARLLHEAHRSLVDVTPSSAISRCTSSFLRLPTPRHRLGVGGIVGSPLGKLDAARRQEVADTVLARLAVHVRLVVAGQLEGRADRHGARGTSSNVAFHARACVEAVSVSTPSMSNRHALIVSGRRTTREAWQTERYRRPPWQRRPRCPMPARCSCWPPGARSP